MTRKQFLHVKSIPSQCIHYITYLYLSPLQKQKHNTNFPESCSCHYFVACEKVKNKKKCMGTMFIYPIFEPIFHYSCSLYTN